MWPVKKYDKIRRRNSLDKRKLKRAQRVFLTFAQVSIIARIWTEHINWKEHELWVVSVVVGIEKSKKKTHDRQNLLIRVKLFNKLELQNFENE